MEMFGELCSFLVNNLFIAIPAADIFSQSVSVFAQVALCIYPAFCTCGGTRLDAQISLWLCKHLCIIAGRNILSGFKLLENFAFILPFE